MNNCNHWLLELGGQQLIGNYCLDMLVPSSLFAACFRQEMMKVLLGNKNFLNDWWRNCCNYATIGLWAIVLFPVPYLLCVSDEKWWKFFSQIFKLKYWITLICHFTGKLNLKVIHNDFIGGRSVIYRTQDMSFFQVATQYSSAIINRLATD